MKILQVVFCLLQKYTSLNFLIPLKLRTFSLVVKLRSYLERRTWRFFKWWLKLQGPFLAQQIKEEE